MVEILHSKSYSKEELVMFIANNLPDDLEASISESERETTIIVNSVVETSDVEEKTIEDWYNEWEDLLELISDKSIELYHLKENLLQAEQDIIDNTNFKALYGKNNESIRKAHLRDELQSEYDAKFELELTIADSKRRVEYIKSLMNTQRALIDCGVIE